MNPDHLLELAEQIVQIGTGSPRQAMLNRAVSTAYYALFHAVSWLCVSRTVGNPRSPRHWEIVTPVYRAIDHMTARKVFDRLAGDERSSSALKQVSRAFVELQRARVLADYDPDPTSRCTRKEALDIIRQARSAMGALRALSNEEQLVLVARLLSKQR